MKSTKRFILSTSQLNTHGFRSLTEGADLTDFIANPIMYWLHVTPEGKSREELLPIGFWEDIKVEGDEISAVPNFDDNDDFAMQIYNKVEHGTLRAASVEVEPVSLDTNKKNWLPGQKLPTVCKWKIGEASIVDRGSNKGALVKLRHNGKVIALADQAEAGEFFDLLAEKSQEERINRPHAGKRRDRRINPDSYRDQDENMKIKLNKQAASHLQLAEDSEFDATDVVDMLVDVIEEKENAITLKAAKVIELEGAVKLLQDAATEGKITRMVDKAISDRKILAGQKEAFIKLAKVDFESTKSILEGMKTSPALRDKLDASSADKSGEVGELMKLSFDELFNSGGLSRLKAIDEESYKMKFKSKFGKMPDADANG